MLHSEDRAERKNAMERLDAMIKSGFVGAVLCDCITIEKHLMDGGCVNASIQIIMHICRFHLDVFLSWIEEKKLSIAIVY